MSCDLQNEMNSQVEMQKLEQRSDCTGRQSWGGTTEGCSCHIILVNAVLHH